MAKIGEGDARWQVADLAESGRNVNNWHWVEKDALDWCKERLTELLVGADLAPGAPDGLAARCTALKACEGEAVVNNRKNKVIAAYELAVTLGWEGAAEAGGEAVTGEVRLPYVSEENHDEDPEMQVATSTEGPAAQKVRAAILAGGKKVVHDAIAVFVKELREGGPMRSGAVQPKAAPAKPVDAVAAAEVPAAAAAQQQQQKTAAEPKAAVAAGGGSGNSVELKGRFYAGAADLYECFTVPQRIMAYTQSPAEAAPQPGGKLSMFGGSVQGVYRELSPNQRIVMDWRFSNWEEGAWSRVELRFEEPDKGNTLVTMKQTGIPDADAFGNHDVVGVAEAGWRGQVFERIRRVFGFGC
ncbi:activator of 90 kDa heat shock ATPase-like protein 1 [Micractinium conductrix]|uniref:Activator of 90 kDa heat shock ATPase-like protein 1 n=1 Tax=Micractinium conductrix TaxID=554055 RepID=A0A2P6V7Q4_9CHLO|nr:activator of 90 kDa heat shock ATPase-like protein 1 [Micractinium conductrix]|eukprot:PSC70108.1 activator of 90 kDa heat shock ATPase-like protein 1 [Micractinium conductrix]